MARKTKQLGQLIREGREAKGLSVRRLADAVGIDASLISRIETGYIAAPDPKKLQALAEVLEVAPENLYAAAGYERPEGLPEVRIYLRAKYGVSDATASELEDYFKKRIAREKGGRHGKRSK